MKILIIKNDGFGDLTMVIHMLNNLKLTNKSKIQIILSKGSEPLGKYLYYFNKTFFSKTPSDAARFIEVVVFPTPPF